MSDRYPKRQLDPSARVRNYVGQKSGADQGSRSIAAFGGASLRGGFGVASTPPGATQKSNTLPDDPNELRAGVIYEILGEEGETTKLVTVVRNPDGSHEYRDVIQHIMEWPAVRAGEFGGIGAGNGQFLGGEITSIAVRRANGNVLVAADGRIQEFTSNGTFVRVFKTLTSIGHIWADDAASSPGQLFVMDLAGHGFRRYNLSTTAENGTIQGSFGSGANQFNEPWGVGGAYNPSTGVGSTLYADTFNNRLILWSAGAPTAYVMATGLNGPRSLVMDQKFRSWVVNTGDHNILVYPWGATLTPEQVIGKPGSGPGELWIPRDIDRDAHENIYVADTGNHRIVVFDRNGVYAGFFGKFGDGPGEFNRPTSVKVTNDYIYVGDTDNQRVQIFLNPIRNQSFIVGEATATWDPPSLGVGGSTRMSGFFIPGALPGDLVDVSHTAVGTLTILFTGNVTSPDFVDIYAFNVNATTAQNVPSGLVRVRVTR